MSKTIHKARNGQGIDGSQLTGPSHESASAASPRRRRAPAPRVPRGIRMAPEVWDFVDGMAQVYTHGNASALIEKLVRKAMAKVKEAA